ncbi:GH92 family glycosyl hydrolase [Sunxiuqinia sp. A32]|uniref:GH92 family glycosyl hydrolase n=1 Tax=Sunxiuqinia sp. A32 TaxID=3461496 RepID=UPI00404656D6
MLNKQFRIVILTIAIAFGNIYNTFCQKIDPTDWVNPFIGSTNFGTTNPGAIVPQGMVSVVPFNVSGSTDNKWDKDSRWWSTPYSWDNHYFTGYSHVNLSGVGCPELGVIILIPTTGPVSASNTDYGSLMSKQKASPGYYSNFLDKYSISTEVTASARVGLSKFKFPEGQSNILLDLGTGLTNESGASLRIVNNQEIEGWRMTGTFCYNDRTERPVYFVARFSKPATTFGAWKKMPKMKAEAAWSATSGEFKFYPEFQTQLSGDSIGAYLTFNTLKDEEILVKVAVSYVSIENARQNMDVEMPGFNFDETHAAAQKKWKETLSRISVKGGTDDQKTVFYTALYHMQIHPNIINDVNGQYPLMESYGVGEVKEGDRYTTFSLWDTYRNFHPLMSLIYPEQQLDMVRSMIAMHKESGWLPKWELNSTETHVMEGDPSIAVITDTYLRGLTDFDIESAYEAMYKSATTEGSNNKLRPDIDDYLEKGYIPYTKPFDNSVSHALEYYIADWNLAQIAKTLGRDSDYERFQKQSLRYKEYFDKEDFQMIRPRMADGSFYKDFDPKQGENFEPSPGFHEGNAYQYTFCVPHDILGLKKLLGGNKNFIRQLQTIFDEGHYDVANEPDIHYPWLFNYIKGEEWRTQTEVKQILDNHYLNQPGGIPGNDDCGTLSAWAVYSMMGFYPVCPGNMDYAIAQPVFDEVTIQLDQNFYSGKELIIRKKGTGKFIKKISKDSKNINSYFINHKELVSGGMLEIEK